MGDARYAFNHRPQTLSEPGSGGSIRYLRPCGTSVQGGAAQTALTLEPFSWLHGQDFVGVKPGG